MRYKLPVLCSDNTFFHTNAAYTKARAPALAICGPCNTKAMRSASKIRKIGVKKWLTVITQCHAK